MTDVVSLKKERLRLAQDVSAIEVPSGMHTLLPEDTSFEIVHELGGDFTIRTELGLMYRVLGKHAAALGREAKEETGPALSVEMGKDAAEEVIWSQLRTCYDPEIPVNVVDLGLIYELVVVEDSEGGYSATVKMTLTAPGCGMGQVLADDVQRKICDIEGVSGAEVELTFDPPWEPSRMSEVARLQTGLM